MSPPPVSICFTLVTLLGQAGGHRNIESNLEVILHSESIHCKAIKIVDIISWIYHTKVKKVKATDTAANELSPDSGPIEIKVSSGPGDFHSLPLYLFLRIGFGMNTWLWSNSHGPQAGLNLGTN